VDRGGTPFDLRKAPYRYDPRAAIVHSVGGPGSVNGVVVIEHADNAPRAKTRLAGTPRVETGKKYYPSPTFSRKGRFIASTRRHIYDTTPGRRSVEVDRMEIAIVELSEDGAPGSRKLAVPMDERAVSYGDAVRVWKSYRDGRYHYEGVYEG
jgi:hypothetical protein